MRAIKRLKVLTLMLPLIILYGASFFGTLIIFWMAIMRNPLYILLMPIIPIVLKIGEPISSKLRGGD